MKAEIIIIIAAILIMLIPQLVGTTTAPREAGPFMILKQAAPDIAYRKAEGKNKVEGHISE